MCLFLFPVLSFLITKMLYASVSKNKSNQIAAALAGRRTLGDSFPVSLRPFKQDFYGETYFSTGLSLICTISWLSYCALPSHSNDDRAQGAIWVLLCFPVNFGGSKIKLPKMWGLLHWEGSP